jgi:hypothetical protein
MDTTWRIWRKIYNGPRFAIHNSAHSEVAGLVNQKVRGRVPDGSEDGAKMVAGRVDTRPAEAIP